jgi:hypothetical protein
MVLQSADMFVIRLCEKWLRDCTLVESFAVSMPDVRFGDRSLVESCNVMMSRSPPTTVKMLRSIR